MSPCGVLTDGEGGKVFGFLCGPHGTWKPWVPVPNEWEPRNWTDCCQRMVPREWLEYRWLDEGMSPYDPIVQVRCRGGRGCCQYPGTRKRGDLHEDAA